MAADVSQRSDMPFRAPLVLWVAPDDDSTFVTVTVATPGLYRIVLGAENCRGATACRLGEVNGQRLVPGTPLPPGDRVTLPGVGPAVFQESSCAVYCSDGMLTWDQDGARYSVGLKAAELDDIRPVAASVVRLP